MSFSPLDYLQHILDEVNFLFESAEEFSRADFLTDQTLQRACVRSLEIIGEATKNIPREFRASQPQIEWRSMAGMRDHLIHAYFSVDYELVWDVMSAKIPQLREQLYALIETDE